ncbi:hypothetical protein N24_1821 [Corynebacterium suranareeae]|uniref:DUF6973 domain-containing protein n=1 Tax=Corynebacterium suranareeae TaxID=2506452 RepID=A0A160PSF0_9CORY|nr:hypothetical protein [Corynebacterium suranareeae]BAU96083.1 hypothetical protein N24_1821 [Corynebacterium suranareeae]
MSSSHNIRKIFSALAVSFSVSLIAIAVTPASAQEPVITQHILETSVDLNSENLVDTSDFSSAQILQAQKLINVMKKSENIYEYFGTLSDVEQRSIIAAIEQNPYLIEDELPRMRTQNELTDENEKKSPSEQYKLYMTILEMLSCINLVDVPSCALANQAANIAESEARIRYPDSTTNGKGDAFRHCTWSALMTIRIGEDGAEKIGNAHETVRRGEPEEREMDLINNALGRDVGGRFTINKDEDGALNTCASMANIGLLHTLI